jgi:hypothetical protein
MLANQLVIGERRQQVQGAPPYLVQLEQGALSRLWVVHSWVV